MVAQVAGTAKIQAADFWVSAIECFGRWTSVFLCDGAKQLVLFERFLVIARSLIFRMRPLLQLRRDFGGT